MSDFSTNYQLLIHKLDEFIRKYYINQIIKGLIYSVTIILGIYLTFSVSEYYFFFEPAIRKVMFFGFIIAMLGTIYYFIGRPLLQYFHLGRIISHDQAAAIIGKHFTDVSDKLLNVLQLKRQSELVENRALIEASINQKIEKLKPVPFAMAIDFSGNKKYFKYAILPLLAFVFILFAAPNILRESNTRLINNGKRFEKKAPFSFLLKNQNLTAVQFDDFDLEVLVHGEVLPGEVFAVTEGHSVKLTKTSSNTFVYKFKKLQKDIDFHLAANGFTSKDYQIRVLPKPVIVGFEAFLDYPGYTGKKDEKLQNIGDLVIPIGTRVQWSFMTKNTDEVILSFLDSTYSAKQNKKEGFAFSKTLLQDSPYKLYVNNSNVRNNDSVAYFINVIPDRSPNIQVEKFEDSTNNKLLYFLGEASDDYGLKIVSFHFKHAKASSNPSEKDDYVSLPVKAAISERHSKFSYTWDISQLDVLPGDKLSYFFMVWDNDEVFGSKYSKTPTMYFEMPTVEEFKEMTKQTNEKIKEELSDGIKEAQKLNKEIKDLQEKLLQKDDLNWEDKKAIEKLLEKQKNLQEKVKNTKNNFSKNLDQQSEYTKQEERIKEKQDKLEKLFEEMLSEEMKKMMEEMEKLLEKMNQEKALDELQNFEMNNKQLEKELDRMLELFKQLELEQKMEEAIQDLEKLANEQESLQKETEKAPKEKNEELSKQQKDINEKFEDIKENLEDIQKLNEELDKENPEENEELKEEIDQNLEQSLEQLKQNQNKKSSQSQKKAGEKMKQMAQKMSESMQSMEMEQLEIDMKALQQLLDNIIKLSFDQEQLMDDFKAINVNAPKYVELVQKQHKLKNDAKMIEDSLFALSKRIVEISSFVNKEVADVNKNMNSSIQMLADRRKAEAGVRQQYTMTGLNNLALMLDDIMKMLQQQMAGQMAGNRMCQNPSSGKGSQQMKGLGDMQKQMNEQLKKMQGEMKKGGSQGKGEMSKEMAQMAARQAAIRKALQELNQQLNKDGKGSLGDLEKIAQEMEKTEEDIVNKKLTEEMLKRQQEILVRLLEAEKAERERETSPERESQSPEKIANKIPPSLEEYLQRREAEVDLYKTVPPALKPFYKNLVEEYFKSISTND